MSLAIDPDYARFRLEGAEFEPVRSPAWETADEPTRRDYWRRVADFAVIAKRRELREGKDRTGKKLKPVKMQYRRDHADGPPLSPHRSVSRFQKWLRSAFTADHATLFWSHGWARIVTYHAVKRGPRSLPIRDVVGLSDASRRWVASNIRLWWEHTHRPAAIVPRLVVHSTDRPRSTSRVAYVPAGMRASPRSNKIQVVD
jgi:hypothetical protein